LLDKGEKMKFNPVVIEKLDYYVYFLQDPITEEVFYVGKGTGNRVFDHLDCAIESEDGNEKLDRIRAIINSENRVKHFILRHGLSEEMAFEVESALIDFVGMKNLSNLQSGHYSSDYGIKTAEEITAMYETEGLTTKYPIMLININKLYDRQMTDVELYDATRKAWVVGARRENVKYAVATYHGLTREVYEIKDWYQIEVKGKTRWGFTGVKASDKIRDSLRYKSIEDYVKQGAANPIRYLNC
jgi:uncharacterized protein